MTRRLILMRHAKSSWDHPGLDDHARPLNGRGAASAEALGLSAPVTVLEALYHASPQAMMQVLRQAKGRAVLMLGHNPGIAEFAHHLAAAPPPHPRFDDYPTGAAMVADLPIADWAQAEGRSATVLDFVIPREIMG